MFAIMGSFLMPTVSAQEPPRTYPNQTASVLVAALNPNPNVTGVGDADIAIDNNALVSAVSPDGTSIFESSRDSDQIARYIVREGDTLSSIAKMFEVSVNTIRWSNDIAAGNVIHEGQELIILPVNGVRYTVKKGDTLAGIAKKYKGDVDEISNFNGLAKGEKLVAGDEVVIPNGVISTPSPAPRSKTSVGVVRYTGPEMVGYYTRPSNGIKTQGLHGNNGIDIGAPVGTQVVAAASGEIIIARGSGWNGGYGLMVVIGHPNGTQTLYAHLSKVMVTSGGYVVQGQKIAEMGNTGNSTGPHLHFEVRGAKNPF
ncbi:MAG: peptidoglycan DD-metalloendopeptidase family protein [Patescibacteria group bacterium]